MEPQEAESLKGTFWQSDTPDRRVAGQLTIDGRPALETFGPIFDERAVDVECHPSGVIKRMAFSGDSDHLVADWEPRNIHGKLEDGTAVSIVGAQGGRKRSTAIPLEYRQEFRTVRYAILGELVEDRQTFYSCRFRVTGPNWWRSQDGEAVTSDGGRLVSTEEGDERWFEFTPARPLAVRDFDRWALDPIETLASLVTFHPAAAVELYVRRKARSPWRRVHRKEEPAAPESHELLDAYHLGADRCARWIDVRKHSDGLDAAAIDDLRDVAIQTAFLTLASVAEGLHRRLFDDKKRVPALSASDLKQARRAARTAALRTVRELDRSGRASLTDADLAEF